MHFPQSQQERTKGRASFICRCFQQIQTLSDLCGFHWTVCVLGNGLEVSPPLSIWPENAKRLRFVICSIWQTQWRVWRGWGAYITKTNIRHFRGWHHTNVSKLVGFNCVYVLRRCSAAFLKGACWVACQGSLFKAVRLDNLMMSRIIKLHHYCCCI